jgi:hypothetical protein
MPGFKDFNAGDILTADQVDDFLMRQTVMVFDDASARDTALASVLREGMMCYLKSDDTLLQYTGSQWEQAGAPSWLTQYPSGTPETASTLSGQVLMTTGGTATPIWQAHPTHNYIINGAFDVWQRGDSFTVNASGAYTADRWRTNYSTAAPTASTLTKQTFTPGDIAAVGFGDAQFYARWEITTLGTTTIPRFNNRTENARTLAGQEATLSFWARSSSSYSMQVLVQQNFGSGGSATVSAVSTTTTIGTTWQRYSVTFSFPSVAGKTFGANSAIDTTLYVNAADATTTDIWGVQLEAGSVATPFKRHAPSLQGELAACQRYYARFGPQQFAAVGVGFALTTTQGLFVSSLPTTMRRQPTSVEFSDLTVSFPGVTAATVTSLAFDIADKNNPGVRADTTGLTQFRPYTLSTSSATGFLAFGAEL